MSDFIQYSNTYRLPPIYLTWVSLRLRSISIVNNRLFQLRWHHLEELLHDLSALDVVVEGLDVVCKSGESDCELNNELIVVEGDGMEVMLELSCIGVLHTFDPRPHGIDHVLDVLCCIRLARCAPHTSGIWFIRAWRVRVDQVDRHSRQVSPLSPIGIAIVHSGEHWGSPVSTKTSRQSTLGYTHGSSLSADMCASYELDGDARHRQRFYPGSAVVWA
jgi:hypothetical protein